jgi:hypothetical protein
VRVLQSVLYHRHASERPHRPLESELVSRRHLQLMRLKLELVQTVSRLHEGRPRLREV